MKRNAAVIMTAACGLLVALSLPAAGQQAEIRPVAVGQPMPDFSLPAYQGGTVSLSALKGKNVLLVFPRGYAAENAWCTICNYKYAELVELEKARKLRQKYNLEILVVLPYDRDTVTAWLESFPAQLAKVHDWKFPADPAALDDRGKQRLERSKALFPMDIIWEKGKPAPTPFPILVDAERKVSKGLGLFMEEWGGSKVAQNIPSYYILNEKGVVCFKYIAQNTADRPTPEYLIRVVERLCGK